LTSNDLTPRSIRRRNLEAELYYNPTLSHAERDEKRRAWAKRESDHLRETRVLKVHSGNAMRGKDTNALKYDVVKVLGKGSFGVVRLVVDKTEKE
jgi:protein-serine/threonine kinase